MSEDDDLQDLRKQTEKSDRLDEVSSEQDQQEFVDDILAQLEKIEAGDEQKTLSVWDGRLAAFVRALEENPEQMETVGHALQSQLGVDETEVDRSEVLRLTLRLGFQEAAPEEFDAVREAVQKQAAKGL